jgi:hypothetical protein
MAAGNRGDEPADQGTTNASARFLALKERARNLGWGLFDEGTGYLLRPFGQGTAVACTKSPTLPDSEEADNAASGLDNVGRMLDQIEAAKRKPSR